MVKLRGANVDLLFDPLIPDVMHIHTLHYQSHSQAQLKEGLAET